LTTREFKTYFARLALFIILLWGTWLAVLPEYSLSPWMPYQLMRFLGMPYSALLWLDHNIATAIHFCVALIGTALLYYSDLFIHSDKQQRLKVCVLVFAVLALATEIVQISIGRGFQMIDLIAGLLGISLAYTIGRHLKN
jgi:hypothetical protein